MRKLLTALFVLAFVSPAVGQSVQQSGSVSRGHAPWWVTSGVIGDAGTSADSNITSLGVTSNSANGFCVNSDRVTAAGHNSLCFGAQTSGPATITLQNYGTAAAQNLEFIVNGAPIILPTGGGA